MRRHFFALAGLLLLFGGAGFVLPTPLGGVVETTPLLNGLHCLAAVVAAVAATRGIGTMRAAGRILGVFFAALAITAFAADATLVNHLLPLTTDNGWLHLVIALTFLYYALLAPPTL